MLKISREEDRARRRTKKLQEEKKRLSEAEDHEKQRLATFKRLKRGDENELERKLRLEKVVSSKQLRLTVETEEERRARLENDAATKRLRLAMEMDEERNARLEKMIATTQLRLALETERRAKKKGMDLIWIEIGVFKKQNISKIELARPVMRIIFLVALCCLYICLFNVCPPKFCVYFVILEQF